MELMDLVEVVLKCNECGNMWTVIGYNELGGFFLFDEEDWYCEDCGGEGEREGG